MIFLAPTAALVAGAIALPTLAVLYLLKLRRRPLRVSSTLLWRQAYEDLEANIPWRWVRPSWLVLVHLLLVALLVLAIGRPAIGAGGEAASRIVFIIDRSASMGARDGDDGGTRLEEAKRRALRIVEDAMRMGRNVEAAVISAAAEGKGLTPLTTDRRRVRDAIESIDGTDQPLDLEAAMQLAGAVLGNQEAAASETSAERESSLVVVLSDGSAPPVSVAAPAGASVRLERVGPSPMSVAEDGTDRLAAQDHDNVGIVTFSARRDPENPASLRVFLELHNASRRDREAVVVLSLAGVERARQATPLPPSDAQGAGKAAMTMEIVTREAGVLTARLVGSDLLSADDAASMLIAAPRSPSILIVSPDAPATSPVSPPTGAAERTANAPPDSTPPEDPITPAWLLESILTELNPAVLRVVDASRAAPLLASPAAGFDLIVFDRVTPAVTPPSPSIVLGGGMPSLGVTSSPPSADGDRDFVLTWDRTHPLLRDVSLDSVFAIRGVSLGRESAGAAMPGVRRIDLAQGASGPVIALVESGGLRHVVVAFDLDHSNWGVQVGFSIFLANAVDFLTLRPEEASGSARRLADAVEIEVPSSVSAVTLQGPVMRQVRLPSQSGGPAGAAPATRTVSLGRLERTGVYDVLPAGVRPGILAENLLDPLETALGTSDEIPVKGRAGGARDGASASLPREIGHYLLLAVLGLLVVEWALYARSARV